MTDHMDDPGMTYRQIYDLCVEMFKVRGVPEAALDARLILEHVCGTSHHDLLAHPDVIITPEQERDIRALAGKRAERIPLSYLTGTRDFMGLTFDVCEEVLIPRQDTELLVEEALILIHDGMRFLDLCTGSGCVALSILSYTNDTFCVATDISEKAVEAAKRNADKLRLSDRIRFVNCDLFPGNEKRFDLIVSNPPYIRAGEIESLQDEVRRYEPRLALDGGEDGLLFYRRITDMAADHLFSNGYLAVEIGYDQGKAVAGLFRDAGFTAVEVVKDLGGKDRVVKGCWIDSNR